MKNLAFLLLFPLATAWAADAPSTQIASQIRIMREFIQEVKQSPLVAECEGILNPRLVARIATVKSASAEVKNAFEMEWLSASLDEADRILRAATLEDRISSSNRLQYHFNHLVEFIQSTRRSIRMQQSRFVVAAIIFAVKTPNFDQLEYLPGWFDFAFLATDRPTVLEFVTMMITNLGDRADFTLGKLKFRIPKKISLYLRDNEAESAFREHVRALNALIDFMNAGSVHDSRLLAAALPLAVDSFVIGRLIREKKQVDLLPTEEMKRNRVLNWLDVFIGNNR